MLMESSWQDILKEYYWRNQYPKEILSTISDKDLTELESKYILLQETYGHPAWLLIEPMEYAIEVESKTPEQTIEKLHRKIDNEMKDERRRIERDVDEEMRTMPELKNISQPSKKWDSIRDKMIREKLGGV
tara:strand:+ start:143 stop:535 length:393 start_codon:yes stop_codon:yes gene_type:complete